LEMEWLKVKLEEDEVVEEGRVVQLIRRERR